MTTFLCHYWEHKLMPPLLRLFAILMRHSSANTMVWAPPLQQLTEESASKPGGRDWPWLGAGPQGWKALETAWTAWGLHIILLDGKRWAVERQGGKAHTYHVGFNRKARLSWWWSLGGPGQIICRLHPGKLEVPLQPSPGSGNLGTPVRIQGLNTRSTYATEVVRKAASLLSIWERSSAVSLFCSSFQQIGGCCPRRPRWIFFICLSAGKEGIWVVLWADL